MKETSDSPLPPLSAAERRRLDREVKRLRPDLVETLRQLVRIPSENLPPDGNERACQRYLAGRLRSLGLKPDLYDILQVPGLASHPEFFPGRRYEGRPNLNAVIKGAGGGRSLVLSGHIDTVPADTPVEWRHAPFGAEIDSGNLFGRGAFDMKAGVAMNLTILAAIRSLGLKLGGDLIFETVVDEEYGGVNGTLAARLRGYTADAAVLTEPTYLKICPAQRGGRTLHIFLRGAGGILPGERPSGRVIDQLTYILAKVPEFAEQRRRRVPVHPYYTGSLEPFAVWVTNISTGRWGWSQPITVPERCRIEIYWQAMPDETRQEVEGEFFGWWNQIVAHRPDLFARPPEVTLPMRWLPGCSIPPDSPLVEEFSATASAAGLDAQIEGMDAPSDMYIFPRCFNMPALMWGPKGAAAHQADESVELDSLVEATRVLLHFVCRWCGVKAARA